MLPTLKRLPSAFLFLMLFTSLLHAQSPGKLTVVDKGAHCINSQERSLYRLITEYRRKRGLPGIPLSESLSVVARAHVRDLDRHYSPGGRCNLHSWSSEGNWSACCYTDDHRRAACMWDKPRELTSYKGDGYEIAFFSNYNYPTSEGLVADALESWKKSPGHHDLIINHGKWATANWKAIGVGVYNGYVVVWFGEAADEAGTPGNCEE